MVGCKNARMAIERGMAVLVSLMVRQSVFFCGAPDRRYLQGLTYPCEIRRNAWSDKQPSERFPHFDVVPIPTDSEMELPTN